MKLCRRRRIERFLRSADGPNIGEEEQKLFRRMMRKKQEEMNESETGRRAEEINSKLKRETGAAVETGSLKKRHLLRS